MIIPGFFPGGAVGTSGVSSLDSVDSTTSNAQTITAPATVNAGDLLILFDFPLNLSGAPANVVPANFTQILTAAGTVVRTTISYKIADGSEGGTSITGMNGNLDNDKVMLRVVPNRAIDTIAAGSVASEVTSGNPSAQNCTAGAGTTPLIVLAQYAGADDVSGQTRTFSTGEDAEINSSIYHYVKYKIYNSSPANTNVDIGDAGGNNCLASFYLEAS